MTHHRVFIQVHNFFIGVALTTNCPACNCWPEIHRFCTFVIGSRVLLVIGIYESFHELNSQLISQFSQAGLFEISTTQTFGQLGCGDYRASRRTNNLENCNICKKLGVADQSALVSLPAPAHCLCQLCKDLLHQQECRMHGENTNTQLQKRRFYY